MPLKNTWGELITDDEADDSASGQHVSRRNAFCSGTELDKLYRQFIEVRR